MAAGSSGTAGHRSAGAYARRSRRPSSLHILVTGRMVVRIDAVLVRRWRPALGAGQAGDDPYLLVLGCADLATNTRELSLDSVRVSLGCIYSSWAELTGRFLMPSPTLGKRDGGSGTSGPRSKALSIRVKMLNMVVTAGCG